MIVFYLLFFLIIANFDKVLGKHFHCYWGYKSMKIFWSQFENIHQKSQKVSIHFDPIINSTRILSFKNWRKEREKKR